MSLIEKKGTYFSSKRYEIDVLLPASANKILDIGCGNGSTLARIHNIYPDASILGIDINDNAIKNSVLNTEAIISHDLNKGLPDLPASPYDLILCLDIIEHLYDPARLLSDLKKTVSSSGCIIVSLPNLRYWQICYDLIIKGDFKYEEQGLMDYTHIRWFTYQSAKRLFEDSGFIINSCRFHPGRLSGKYRFLNHLPYKLVKELFSWQLMYKLVLP